MLPPTEQDLHSEELLQSVQSLPEPEAADALAPCSCLLLRPHEQSQALVHPNPPPVRNLHKGASRSAGCCTGPPVAFDLPDHPATFYIFLKPKKQHCTHLLSTCVLVRKSLVSRLSVITVDLSDRFKEGCDGK